MGKVILANIFFAFPFLFIAFRLLVDLRSERLHCIIVMNHHHRHCVASTLQADYSTLRSMRAQSLDIFTRLICFAGDGQHTIFRL